jgi:selenocysteine lyase/cysteine desulfurase
LLATGGTDAAARNSIMPASIPDNRGPFPALARQHGGLPVAYFGGPDGTQVPRQVVAAMTEDLFHHNANAHSAFPTSRETDDAIAAAREALADFANASPAEVAFGANMTTLTFHLARWDDVGDQATRSWSPN